MQNPSGGTHPEPKLPRGLIDKFHGPKLLLNVQGSNSQSVRGRIQQTTGLANPSQKL